jgi:hypothetical protein
MNKARWMPVKPVTTRTSLLFPKWSSRAEAQGIGKPPPNKACRGRVGMQPIFERFPGFESFPFQQRVSSRPLVG